jgi:aminopeptidase N
MEANSARTLTRDEASARAALIQVESYDIELDLTTGDETYHSITNVRFRSLKPGISSFIELLAEQCHSITLNGAALDPRVAYNGERISLEHLLTDNELVVEADCAYTQSGEGIHRFVDPEDERTYLYTECFLYEAQRIFACFDQPDLKASFRLRVRAPQDWIVVGNGSGSQQSPGEWAFEPTPPLPTYLFAICGGPYHVVGSEHAGMPVSILSRQSLIRYLNADEIFDTARRSLDFFGELFGRPYPFSKLDLVFVPELQGAMENAACITFTDEFLFRPPISDAQLRSRDEVIAHEIAHMWFGDLVSMRWWDDLWLNESFATYMANLALAEATRHKTIWTTFVMRDKVWGYWADQLPSTHPISADVPDAIATMLNLDGISYSKGAGVLKQLVAWVGFEPFRRGLAKYIEEHAFSNTTIRDLLAAFGAASGRDLEAWSREWLETAGLADLYPDGAVLEDGRYGSFVVVQTAPAAQPTLRSHRLAIGLYDRQDGQYVRRKRLEIDIAGRATDVPELVGTRAADLVVLNDDDLTWARTRLDDRSLHAVLDGAIPAIHDSLTRAVLLLAVREMMLDALLPVGDYVRIAADALGTETEISLLEDLYRRVILAISRFGDPAARDGRLADLADRSLAWLAAASPGGDLQLAHARGVMRTAVTPDQTGLIRGWLEGSGVPNGLTLGQELRWLIVARLATLGLIGADEIDAEQRRDPTYSGAARAGTARASLPSAETKARIWREALSPEPPSLGILHSTLAGFWHSEQVELARPFVERYVRDIAPRWGESQQIARELGYSLFPWVVAEPSTVDIIRGAMNDGLDPAFRRIIAEGLDDLERSIRTRAADTPATGHATRRSAASA